MSRNFDFLLLGGGTSCAYAAVSIRNHDKDSSVAILGIENEPPYDRPPFTKYFLWNDEKVVSDFHSKDESFYPENNVELLLGRRATAIDLAGKTVTVESGESFGYGRLLYALGSEPSRPPIEGADSAWVLRTSADSARIRAAASPGAIAVIVGAGYIGAELAGSLAGRGCEVILIERGPRVWSGFPSQAVAEAAQRELESKNVRVVTGAAVQAIRDGRAVATDKGTFEGDFVVLGVGARPSIELANQAGLAVGEGVLADARLRSSNENVFVAGDVLEYPDPYLGAHYRVEHHLHAKGTADRAGANMAGKAEDYDGVPYFFSDVGDMSMQLRGYPDKASRSFLVSNSDEPLVTEVWLFEDGRIAGFADFRKDYKAQDPLCELFEKLIKARARIGALEADLAKPGFDVSRLGELL